MEADWIGTSIPSGVECAVSDHEVPGRGLDKWPLSKNGSSAELADCLGFVGDASRELDEFFMAEMDGLRRAAAYPSQTVPSVARLGKAPTAETWERIRRIVREIYATWHERVRPMLASRCGLVLLQPGGLTEEQRQGLERRFFDEVWPLLTLLAVDQTHPFPTLRCRSLNLAMLLHDICPSRRQEVLTIVEIPAVLGRLVELSQATDGQIGFILIEDLIAMHASKLFPGFRVSGCAPFRLTRDRNNVGETVADWLTVPRAGVRQRHVGKPVRLEIASGSPEAIETFLRRTLQLEPDDVYRIDGPLQLSDLSEFGNWTRQTPHRRAMTTIP